MFLLDQGLPRSTVQCLAALGVSSQHVGDMGLAAATDSAILACALQNKLVVVTLDADFHAALATSGATRPSVIRLRIEGLDGAATATILHQALQAAAAELSAGAMVTIKSGNLIRVRRLPVT